MSFVLLAPIFSMSTLYIILILFEFMPFLAACVCYRLFCAISYILSHTFELSFVSLFLPILLGMVTKYFPPPTIYMQKQTKCIRFQRTEEWGRISVKRIRQFSIPLHAALACLWNPGVESVSTFQIFCGPLLFSHRFVFILKTNKQQKSLIVRIPRPRFLSLPIARYPGLASIFCNTQLYFMVN